MNASASFTSPRTSISTSERGVPLRSMWSSSLPTATMRSSSRTSLGPSISCPEASRTLRFSTARSIRKASSAASSFR